MVSITIQLLCLLALPYLWQYLARQYRWVDWLSTAFFCYVSGILLGNIPAWGMDLTLSRTMSEITVVLAIPLLLFSTHLASWIRMAPKALLSLLLFICSVILCAALAVFLWKGTFEEIGSMGAMGVAVYTGGTANMAAIHLALGVPETIFLQMNFMDMFLGAGYLFFLLTLAQKILGLLLPAYPRISHDDTRAESVQFEAFTLAQKLAHVAIALLAAGGIVGVSAGISWIFLGKVEEVWVIISLTIGGLGASCFPQLRTLSGTYETGSYLFLIFCVAMGMLIDLQLFFSSTYELMGFMALIMYGAIGLHVGLAAIFRIDTDTAIITATAGVFGPPFIGPVAHSLGNREIVVTGMTMGTIGLAIGNISGLVFAWLFEVI